MQITLIVLVFIILCALMYSKKLNSMFALPIMALLIAVIAGIPWNSVTAEDGTVTSGIQSLLFVEGPMRLASTMITLIFGGILSQLIKNTGIAESTIRKVSELGGDRPLIVAILFYIVVGVLFTTLGGLGSVIMIGTIVLPILTSMGVSAIGSACILLFSLSVGGIFNLANWSLYINSLEIPVETVRGFAYFAGVIFFLMGLFFIVLEVRFGGLTKIFSKKGKKVPVQWPMPAEQADSKAGQVKVHWFAMLTPLIPLVFVLGFKMDINTGLIFGILYGFLTTIKKDSVKQLARSITEGISNTAGAIFLLIGIGMLLKVVMDPRVSAIVGPAMAAILPSAAVTYVIFFSILAPLALYRGPLNIWGLGLGLATVMLGTGKLGATSIMAALMTTGQIQGICDPTNTYNVWVAASTGTDVNDLMKKTLPYVWCGAIIGLIVAAFLYF